MQEDHVRISIDIATCNQADQKLFFLASAYQGQHEPKVLENQSYDENIRKYADQQNAYEEITNYKVSIRIYLLCIAKVNFGFVSIT